MDEQDVVEINRPKRNHDKNKNHGDKDKFDRQKHRAIKRLKAEAEAKSRKYIPYDDMEDEE